MSPHLHNVLRAIERETRSLATRGLIDDIREGRPNLALYPRDYYRPAELLWRWRGPGRFFDPSPCCSGS